MANIFKFDEAQLTRLLFVCCALGVLSSLPCRLTHLADSSVSAGSELPVSGAAVRSPTDKHSITDSPGSPRGDLTA